MKRLNLTNFQHGAVVEMFEEEVAKLIDNVNDINTAPDKTRAITIKISIKPDKQRQVGTVKTEIKSVLAPVLPNESILFFGKDENGREAIFEDDFRQEELIPRDEKIVVFPERKEA